MIYSNKEYSVFGNLCKKADGDNRQFVFSINRSTQPYSHPACRWASASACKRVTPACTTRITHGSERATNLYGRPPVRRVRLGPLRAERLRRAAAQGRSARREHGRCGQPDPPQPERDAGADAAQDAELRAGQVRQGAGACRPGGDLGVGGAVRQAAARGRGDQRRVAGGGAARGLEPGGHEPAAGPGDPGRPGLGRGARGHPGGRLPQRGRGRGAAARGQLQRAARRDGGAMAGAARRETALLRHV